jgi:hypothetical protein
MSNFIDTYIENVLNRNYEISLSVQFWLYLISNILSIICCVFVLFYLVFDRTLRQQLHNHIIIILLFICLIYELTDIPFILYNSRFGISWILYRFWSFIDIGLYTTHLIIFAWGTIERYILVFHDQWLRTEKKRFYIHYLPLIILIIYCLVWYSVIILFPSCDDIIHQPNIPYPCMMYDSSIKYFDLICHQVLPSFVIIIFSIALVLRARWQKTGSTKPAKQRKLIFQILSISILYLIFCSPWAFVLISFQFNSLENIGLNLMPYAYFFSYYFIFLFPFVCCASLPEVLFKLKNALCRQRSQPQSLDLE